MGQSSAMNLLNFNQSLYWDQKLLNNKKHGLFEYVFILLYIALINQLQFVYALIWLKLISLTAW